MSASAPWRTPVQVGVALQATRDVAYLRYIWWGRVVLGQKLLRLVPPPELSDAEKAEQAATGRKKTHSDVDAWEDTCTQYRAVSLVVV